MSGFDSGWEQLHAPERVVSYLETVFPVPTQTATKSEGWEPGAACENGSFSGTAYLELAFLLNSGAECKSALPG